MAPLAAQVRCLNEAVAGSCRSVFKPWEHRLEPDGPRLCSQDDDPELLLHVPFDGAVKLKAISIIGGPNGTSPDKLRVRTWSRRWYGGGCHVVRAGMSCCVAQRLSTLIWTLRHHHSGAWCCTGLPLTASNATGADAGVHQPQ